MSADLTARIDGLERKLRSLERELTELRALAQAESPDPGVARTPALAPALAPADDPQARLRELADGIRRAEASGDAETLFALAARAENISPSADPEWQAYAQQLADYARTLAATAKPVAAPAHAAPTDVRARLKELAVGIRRAEAEGDAETLRALAARAEKIAPSADPVWQSYAGKLAEYARSSADSAKASAKPTSAATPVAAKPVATRAAAPAAKPRPAGRTFQELVRDWDLLGARGVALAGGVVMLLGIAFFFVLATNRGWIGPLARVSLGAAASALVFVAGIVVHRRYGQLHAALAACGAGIAGGYATLAAATILYGLLPPAGALVAAAGIAAAGVVVALAWSSQALAALGFLGAGLSPAALALDEGVSAAGTAFAAVVFAALAVVATRRRWERLLVAGAAVTVLQVVWMVGAADAGDIAAAAVAAAVVALLVGAAAAWQLALRREGLDGLAGSLAATAVAVSLGSAVQLYPDETDQALALLAAGAGLGIAATLLVRRAPDLAYVLGAGALLLAGVATADLLSGTSLAIVFAAQSMLASCDRAQAPRAPIPARRLCVSRCRARRGVRRPVGVGGRGRLRPRGGPRSSRVRGCRAGGRPARSSGSRQSLGRRPRRPRAPARVARPRARRAPRAARSGRVRAGCRRPLRRSVRSVAGRDLGGGGGAVRSSAPGAWPSSDSYRSRWRRPGWRPCRR